MIDERTRDTIRLVASRLYFLTIQFLVLDMMYRQIFLKQNYRDFEDIAVVVTFNAIVFVIAVFWKGALPFNKISIPFVLSVYVAVLMGGGLLGVVLDRFDTWPEFLRYFGRVAGVSTILLSIYLLTAWLGNRNLNKLAAEDLREDT